MKEKIKKLMKSITTTRVGVAILTGITVFAICQIRYISISNTLDWYKNDAEYTENEIDELKNQIEEKDAIIASVQPWFSMQETEQRALEKELSDKQDAELQAIAEQQIINSTKELSNGNFVSGQDFEPGIYNIIAISGAGNVYSDNMFSGGINAMMGVSQGDLQDMYKTEYKNIKLPSGTTLTVDGVTIKITPSN